MICLTLNGHSMLENKKTSDMYRSYTDVYELRVDYLNLSDESELQKALEFPSNVTKPVILTCRRKSDGGQFELDEKNRLDVLTKLSAGKFSFVDLEKDFKDYDLINTLKERGIRIIRSYHNFKSTPENISEIFAELAQTGDIPKLAVKAESISDLERVFRLKKQFENCPDKIIIAMGDIGVPSRILYRFTGSFLMYCSPEEVAPGMLDIIKMKDLYRADKVTDSTELFALIGNPVSHSLSPEIHNRGFKKSGINAIYVSFKVDDVPSFFRLADYLGIKGFSVTAPFKQDVMSYLDFISDECLSIGACNTVIREDNKWKGYNTDYIAACSLFKGSKAVVLGAGGAAKALVKALLSKGFDVTVFNRTPTKAESLAKEAGCRYESMENLGKYSGKADVVIKAVSTAEDIALNYTFSGRENVCDIFYKPVMTPFLIRAKDSGCKITTGADFLKEQGKAQFELFTKTPLP